MWSCLSGHGEAYLHWGSCNQTWLLPNILQLHGNIIRDTTKEIYIIQFNLRVGVLCLVRMATLWYRNINIIHHSRWHSCHGCQHWLALPFGSNVFSDERNLKTATRRISKLLLCLFPRRWGGGGYWWGLTSIVRQPPVAVRSVKTGGNSGGFSIGVRSVTPPTTT